MVNHPNRRRTRKTAATSAEPVHDHDLDYASLLALVAASFRGAGRGPFFVTDAANLNQIYLDSIHSELRQVHNCHACRRFLQTYGGLVTVDETGAQVPAMWSMSPSEGSVYRTAVHVLHHAVSRAKIVGPFYSKDSIWGTPLTDEWRHLAALPPPEILHRDPLLTPFQKMAAGRESYKTVRDALFTDPIFKPSVLEEALRVLKAEALTRSEKFVAPVEWLLEQANRRHSLDFKNDRGSKRASNLFWRAVVTAPEGYLHPRAGVIGSLLEDLAAGLPFEDVRAKFASKVAPLRYQRPQAPPRFGNIDAAERAIEKLGFTDSLQRRYARLEDVIDEAFWRPTAKATALASGGVFGHLRSEVQSRRRASDPQVDLPRVAVTWTKFARNELPSAEKLELLVPHRGAFIALTAPVHPGAPSPLKWTSGVAWYVYPQGSEACQWNLTTGVWNEVTAVVPFPAPPYLADGVILTLRACWDNFTPSNALFPELLNEALHPYRATIEAYSRSAKLSGSEEATACGYDLRHTADRALNCTLRVTAAGRQREFYIDRWD